MSMVKLGDWFSSNDPRDTDQWQPQGRRCVEVVAFTDTGYTGVRNLTTGRRTWVKTKDLLGRGWTRIKRGKK